MSVNVVMNGYHTSVCSPACPAGRMSAFLLCRGGNPGCTAGTASAQVVEKERGQ